MVAGDRPWHEHNIDVAAVGHFPQLRRQLVFREGNWSGVDDGLSRDQSGC
jgi:hypothetical protein